VDRSCASKGRKIDASASILAPVSTQPSMLGLYSISITSLIRVVRSLTCCVPCTSWSATLSLRKHVLQLGTQILVQLTPKPGRSMFGPWFILWLILRAKWCVTSYLFIALHHVSNISFLDHVWWQEGRP
jgi:hypothetical protein